MNNAIELIVKDLQRHIVIVTLPGEQEEKALFLIMITGKTSKLKDFENIYGNKATTTHRKIAKKVFGVGETENVYGVFVDENLRMVFAFNRDFADYDREKEIIIFKDIDDVLLKEIKAENKEKVPIPESSDKRVPRGCDGMGFLIYSLTEK